ncbi:MAG: hypothetical protein JXR37_08930 [Kiritimatiellae bacterium]|nr:hypothetical protein [Kiritimatiellia bacterium]
MKTYEILRQAVERVGAKQVAWKMHLSKSLVYKWCQSKEGPDASGTENPLDRVWRLCELTGDHTPITWLCEQAGGYFTENPRSTPGEPLNALSVTPAVLGQFSRLLRVLSDGLHGPEQMSDRAAATIRREWEGLKRLLEGIVAASESQSAGHGLEWRAHALGGRKTA